MTMPERPDPQIRGRRAYDVGPAVSFLHYVDEKIRSIDERITAERQADIQEAIELEHRLGQINTDRAHYLTRNEWLIVVKSTNDFNAAIEARLRQIERQINFMWSIVLAIGVGWGVVIIIAQRLFK